jgi:hypothetical protein
MTVEDILINTVFHRRSLWDPNHDLHKHTVVLTEECEEVAEGTGKDGELFSLLNK